MAGGTRSSERPCQRLTARVSRHRAQGQPEVTEPQHLLDQAVGSDSFQEHLAQVLKEKVVQGRLNATLSIGGNQLGDESLEGPVRVGAEALRPPDELPPGEPRKVGGDLQADTVRRRHAEEGTWQPDWTHRTDQGHRLHPEPSWCRVASAYGAPPEIPMTLNSASPNSFRRRPPVRDSLSRAPPAP